MNINYLRLLFCAFALSFVGNTISAQQLPDSSFEDWSGAAFDGNAQLKNWRGSNVEQTYLGITARGTMVKKASGAHSGNACAKIENAKVQAGTFGEVSPAWLTLGTPFADISNGISGATAGTHGGMAFTYRPDTLAVWVKRTGSNATSEDMNIVYYSWIGTNSETNYMSKSDGCVSISAKIDEESDIRVRTDKNACQTHNTNATQVAEGFYRTRASIANWTEIKVPITYYTNDIPQKVNVILSAGNYPNFRANSGIYVGNALYVDDIRLIYSSQAHEMYINNRQWDQFSPDVLEYTYALGKGATTVPPITLRRSGRVLAASEYTVTNGDVSGTPTLVEVRAEDGSSTTVYKINFVADQSTNARLAGISVNGKPVANFNGYVTTYNVGLPYGTIGIPEISVTKGDAAQTYEITNCTAIPGSATIKVFAADKNYTQTYTLNFTLETLTDNTLKDILINNKSLTGFSPMKTAYVVEMPIGTTEDPTITPISAYEEGAQTIVVDNKGLNGKSTVKVTPRGGSNTRTYTISYKITESSYSFLKSLKVAGEELPNFDPEITAYEYVLPIGTTALPEITWEKGDEYQIITKEEGGIDGVTKITVTAQNGTITIYRITFSTQKSSVATLADLKIGGITIENFDSEQFNYVYELPIGTTELPEISYTAGDQYQTINIIRGGVNGTTKIVVKAQNGNTNTYNITFSVAQADNTTLKSITVGGVEIPNFSPNVYEYSFLLPRGTTVLPEIGYTQHDEFQTVIVRKGGVNGDTKITVRAQTGVSADYIIHFSVEISSNGLLQAIFVDGAQLLDFEPNKFNYTCQLPVGTTVAPIITYTKGDDFQTVTVDNGGLNGTTQILVVSEDKTSKNTYTIHFSVAQADVSTLLDLQIDGVSVEGFLPETLEYNVLLPRGTTVLPTITAVAHDEFQTIRQTLGDVNGDTKIVVRAQTGAVSTYIIHFSVAKSNNSQLADIQLGGVSIEGFASGKFDYAVTLESGTTELPTIAYTKGDEMQTVFVTKGGVEGETTLRVVAENGSQTTYTITFTVKKSENAFLKNIFVDGTPLVDFEKTDFDYTYILDASATACPAISVEKEEGQSVSIALPKLLGVAKIVVTPEFGANNVYTVTFKLNQSSSSTLSDLTVGGTTIADFDANTLNYNYLLPSGTTVLPEIGFTKSEENQTVSVIRGELNGETFVRVVAEDGSETLYTITFAVAKSAVATLQTILVGGVALADFSPETLDYNYILTRGTAACPTIEVVKTSENQVVCITKPNLEGTAKISVFAEDGSEKTYTISFAFNRSENAQLADIQLDGVQIEGFAAETLTYNVELPNGTTTLPAITYTQGDEYQKVLVTKQGVNGTTTIDVMAENGNFSRYEIAFSVAQSADATLQSLQIGGAEIADFNAETLNYSYVLPVGTTVCPTIEAVKNHAAQAVSMLLPHLEGEAKITVTAEDGTQKIYTVSLAFAPMTNTNLAGITVAGEPLATFDAGTTNYTVDLPFGAALPEIGFVAADETQLISLTNAGLQGAQILVVAQNGDTKTYNVKFNVAANNNALLADIQLYNGSQFVSLANFESETYFYTDSLAWRTAVVPVIHPVAADQNQTITIQYNNVNDTTKIRVVAEDGTTTADYAIAFPVRKSSLTALSEVQIDDAEFTFDPEILDYEIQLPYDTTAVPNISWILGEENGKIVTEQRVTLIKPSLSDTTKLIVTAENGDTRTYKFAFNVASATAENTLLTLVVDGVGNLLEGSEETTFNVNLPYGTNALPALNYSKSYPEQTVLVNNGGVWAPTTITVKANREGEADKIYTIVPNVAKISPAVLSGILVNGTPLAGFTPEKFNYVVNATAAPTITYTAANGLQVSTTVNNSKQKQFTVTTDDDAFSNVYNVFVYYTNDQIPNGEFTQWTTPRYNASRGAVKPTGWNVPADAAESKSVFLIGTSYTGDEIYKQSASEVGLVTKYWSSLMGTIPPVMTIGTIGCDLQSTVNTTVSVSGGITYRNTPDVAKIRYNFVNKQGGDGALFRFTFDGQDKNFVVENEANNYVEGNYLLNLSGSAPSSMNITVNASNNFKSLNGAKNPAGSMGDKLLVDYIRFEHSNKITQLLCNGTALAGFNGDNTTQTLDIASDFQGIPVISAIGEVPDQEYTIAVSPTETLNGGYKLRTVTIASKAEDGRTINYNITLRRALSTNKQLAGLSVDGAAVSGFASTTYTYNVAIANGTKTLPDIAAVRSSMHQTATITLNGTESALVRVTAENGETQDYTINFVEEKSADTTLANIMVVGNGEFVFAAETRDYSLNLAPTAALPEISFAKQSDGQTVTLAMGDTTTLEVLAENGTDRATYTITFVREQATSGKLTAITANDLTLENFDKNSFVYTKNKSENEAVQTTFVREFARDIVLQTITSDSVMWQVVGTETNLYKLKFNKLQSNNANLSAILVDGVALEEFNAYNLEYKIVTDHLAALTAVKGDENQTIAATYNAAGTIAKTLGTFSFAVTAADGETTQNYTVELALPVSDNADLAAILLDNELISTEATSFVADKNFASGITEYTIALPCENPKTQATKMPTISVVAAADGQQFTIENNGLDRTSYITVTAENGSEKIYSLAVTAEKSGNADLSGIAINLVPLADFAADKFDYSVQLADNEQPKVAFTSNDRFQTVETFITSEAVSLQVEAENGTRQTYVVSLEKPLQNNANLANIAVAGYEINFDPNSENYSLLLPSGTTQTPDISIEKGDDNQEVVIENNGVGQKTYIIVTAENGTTERTYTVDFETEKSANALLQTILVNYVPLTDFASTTYEYSVELPDATTPNVTYIRGDNFQSVETETTLNSAVLTVTAENGTESRYVVHFTRNVSNNALLADILIGENSLEDFDANTLNYNLMLPTGTTVLPDILAVASEEGQNISVISGGVRGTTNLVVVAADGVTSQTYQLTFDVEKSAVDTLKKIYTDGEALANFAAQTTTYDIVLPVGTRAIPFITFDKGDALQTVTLDTILVDIANYNAQFHLNVVAENGNTNRYVLNFTIAKSEIDTLKMIYTNYEAIENFSGNNFVYNILLPVGTRQLPLVTFDKSDELQTVKIDTVKNEKYEAQINLTVVAEAGNSKIYEIHFEVEKSAADTLKNLRINGAAIALQGDGYTSDAEFAAQTFEYHVDWAIGSRLLPTIDWVAGDSLQTVSVNKTIESLNDTIVITVTAENGNENRYTIYNNLLRSAVDTLKMIYINSEELPNFVAQTFDYTIHLPVGTRQMPAVDFDKGDEWQTVEEQEVVSETYHSLVTLSVAAEDGLHSNIYTLNFEVEKSAVDTLKAIFVDGELLENYAADNHSYNYLLPIGTAELPEITWELGDGYQSVDTVSNGVNGEFVITITAENGSTATYTINFAVEKSHNADLEAILVAGELLKGFDAAILDYTVKLPYGTTEVPEISFTKAEEIQQVTLTKAANLNEKTIIEVIAEDGETTKTYRIGFEVLKSDNALLNNIFINGEAISTASENFVADADFAPENFLYNIILPYGTTAKPVITWETQVADYNSITLLESAEIAGTSRITVVSQDEMNSNDYELIFTIAKSSNNSLSNLQIAGETLEGFNPDSLVYTLVFPTGTDTTALPTAADITFTVGDETQTVVVSQLEPTVILVTVTAENGDVQVYVVDMEIELSSNSLLKNILLDGYSLRDFDPQTFEYEHLLFVGDTIPAISVVKGEEKQEVFITKNPIGEYSYIYVVAEDKSETEYRIMFRYSTETTSTVPTVDDICWIHIGGGLFKASTRKEKVNVAIYHTNGRLVDRRDVVLVDPNDAICEPGAAGAHFQFEKRGNVYICVFYHEGSKKIIKSEKFIY